MTRPYSMVSGVLGLGFEGGVGVGFVSGVFSIGLSLLEDEPLHAVSKASVLITIKFFQSIYLAQLSDKIISY